MSLKDRVLHGKQRYSDGAWHWEEDILKVFREKVFGNIRRDLYIWSSEQELPLQEMRHALKRIVLGYKR